MVAATLTLWQDPIDFSGPTFGWKEEPAMPLPRDFGAAVALPGKVYALGGFSVNAGVD